MSSSGGSPSRRANTTAPPPPPGMLPIDDSDDQEEEEIISLGLQRNLNSILKSPTPSPSVDAIVAGNNSNTAAAAASTILIGANRKSSYPATPAMMRHANNSNNNGGSNHHMRRTPGPPSSKALSNNTNDHHHHSSLHHHRRTPGAGALQTKHTATTAATATATTNTNYSMDTPQKLHPHQQQQQLQTPSAAAKQQQQPPPGGVATTSSSSSLHGNLSTPQVHNNNSNTNTNFNNSTPSTTTTNIPPTPSATTSTTRSTGGGGGGGRQLYTPAHFTLSKNPDLHGRFNALSPNTLQLTNSIDNLLDDDGDDTVGGGSGNNNNNTTKEMQQQTTTTTQLSSHGSKQQRMRGRGGTPITTNKSSMASSTNNKNSDLVVENDGIEDDTNNIKPTAFRRIHSERRSSSDGFDSDDEELEELNQLQSSVHDDDDDDVDDDIVIGSDDDDDIIGSDDENAALNISGDGSTIASTIASGGGVGGGGGGGSSSVAVVGMIESPQKKSTKEQQHQPIRPTPKHSSRHQAPPGGSQSQQQQQQQQQQQHSRHPQQQQQQHPHQQQRGGRQQHPQQQYPHQQQHPSSHHQHHQQPSGYFSPLHPLHPPPQHNYQYPTYGGVGSHHHPHHLHHQPPPPALHGVVSPITLPTDYGHPPPPTTQHYPPSNSLGYAHQQQLSTNNNHSSSAIAAAAASSTHGSWSPIPEFNVNQPEWHPPGSQQSAAVAASWGGGGGGGGASPYHPPHHQQNYHPNIHHHHHHQGMVGGIIPGHASPTDFGFHAIPGHVSPDMFGGGGGDVRTLSPFMPNFGYPPPQQQQQQHHHPHQHHGSYAPPPPPPPTQHEHPEQPSDRHSIHSHPSSPIKTKGSPNNESRHRKDTATSVGSAFSGSATAAAAAAAAAAVTASPTSPQSSVLKQSRPGLNLAPSDEGPPSHHHGWYNNNNNQSNYSPGGRSLAPPPPSQLAYQEMYDHVSPQHQQGGRGERMNSNGQDVGSFGLFESTSSSSSSPGRISSIATTMTDRQLKKGLSNNDGNVNEVKKYIHPNSPALGVSSQDVRNHPMSSSGAIALEARISRSNIAARPSSKTTAFGGGSGVGGDDEKQFIMESPTERQAFKEFGRNFRQREAESLSAARDYALASITKDGPGIYLPPATHWRVYLELADLAKRSNEIDASRQYYRRACQIQPNASQCWLEYSKLEEESGNLKRCADILEEGLRHCSTNENLLVRALKFYERTGHLDHSRQLLARLKDSSIEKSWKTILEGAQMEARAGRYSIAREWLKYLTHHVPWYGPLYKIHSEFERDYGDPVEAFAIVEKGLKELPRYGPLYLVAFRLLEKDDLSQKAYDLPKTMDMVSRADNISRELLWRVHFEAAQSQERAAVLLMGEKPKLSLKKALYATRRSYSKAIMLSPPNLVWKIWLASGRTEVSCGNTNGARDLFLRAYDCVTEKGRSTVLLECARLEEFCGDLALSRSILCKARHEHGKSDWKVWLSSVNLECRCGLRERAIVFAQDALDIHRGTGRLWAALIQLRHEDGEMSQMKVLKLALKSVPKSGEVWCEGARISLNPFCPTFDLQAASRHLVFAARFTPQYGDSFLEQLRLDMIGKWLVPLAEPLINSMYDAFLKSNKKMGREEVYQFITEYVKKAADAMKAQLKRKPDSIAKDVVDTSELELHCCSANPNYGHLWFQCRISPIDSAREVIAQAKDVMASDIINYSFVYVAAMVRRAGIMMMIIHHPEMVVNNGAENISSNDFDRIVDQQLRLAPTLDVMLSEKEVTGSMFVTGLTDCNKSWDAYSLAEKRRILFGSDSLVN